VSPKIILVLGKVAANTLFENNLALGACRTKQLLKIMKITHKVLY